jgi:ribosomal protein L35
MFHCELCHFLTKSRTKYNKHLTTEDHIKNEDLHEVAELFKLG